ncbi:hypothetical protein Tco_1157700, partial [Tanacetum coccineum]
MVLVYGGNPRNVYINVGFQIDKDDTKSQSGYVFVLNGGTIDWKSAKKRTIAMYSIEAEHIAASKAAMEVFGAKHCQRKYHYNREVMKMGEIVINKVHTDDTVADPFTKPMSLTKHNQHAIGIGLRPASSL